MPSAEDAPVSDDEAANLFAPLRDRAGLILAVSGGPDSSALLVLYARAQRLDPTLPPAIVATVDHRLRSEAADEAAYVAALAARHDLAHRTLVWVGAKPTTDLQAAARRARYALLVDTARDLGFDTVVTAHHAEDQAETFLARLARGSGVVGLAAMAPRRSIDGLVLARPFLDLPRDRLRATLAAAGESWIDDPSNRDARFDRVRLRAAAPLLAELGLTRDRLVATAKAMAAVASDIDRRCDEAMAEDGRLHPAGWASLCAHRFAGLDRQDRVRLIGRLIRTVGGADHAPKRAALDAVEAALSAEEPTKTLPARSLGACLIEKRAGRIWIAPEIGRGDGPRLDLAPGGHGRWYGRRVELANDAPGPITIAPLGRAGRTMMAAVEPPYLRDIGAPSPVAAVIETAPAIFVAGALVACPGLGYQGDATTRWSELVRFSAIDTVFAATGGARDAVR